MRATRPPGVRVEPVVRPKAGGDGSQPAWEEVPGEELGGYHSGRAMLVIAPGGRYRQEWGDEPSGQVRGSDGERGWMWYPPDLAPPPWVPVAVGLAPPFPELFCPSELLSGLTLEIAGPATACGRDALAVVASPRADIGHVPRLRRVLFDGLEMIVDAELGILLRREETFEGRRLSLTELTAVVLDPAEARTAPGSRRRRAATSARTSGKACGRRSAGRAGTGRRPPPAWPPAA